jgi:hypothetical protein
MNRCQRAGAKQDGEVTRISPISLYAITGATGNQCGGNEVAAHATGRSEILRVAT